MYHIHLHEILEAKYLKCSSILVVSYPPLSLFKVRPQMNANLISQGIFIILTITFC